MYTKQILTVILTSSLLAVIITLSFLYVVSPGVFTSSGEDSVLNSEVNDKSRLSQDGYESNSVVSMIEKVNPAVVSVVISKDVPIYEQYYEEINPWGFFGGFSVPRQREIGTEEKEVGGGSGFVVSKEGLIVTNRHVVSDKDAHYSILTNDAQVYEVEVLARDSQLDIAILRITDPLEEELSYLKFGNSESLKLGQTVVAIGNALSEFRNSVSVGVVSGLARSITATDIYGKRESLEQVIQTDAAINPGNSGGPLLNLSGEVIGVNVATSRGADNIGFALPAHAVSMVVESVKKHGRIVRPFIGVRYVMIDESLKNKNNIPVDYGALVIRGQEPDELAVMPGSPADRIGLIENDIILEIDGVKLKDTDLATVLRTKQVGDRVELVILHKGEKITKNAVLEEIP